jgi:hypothetical protein
MAIKQVVYNNKYGYPQTMVIDIIEEDDVFIFGKRVDDGMKKRIEKADIKSITEAVVEKIKS